MSNSENIGGIPTADQLAKINRLSRRILKESEVFVFSVVLCDNEIDRDNERFSIEALNTLAKLYIGKTGIFDHSMHGRDQCARIFDCSVERDESITTEAGEIYHCVKAQAYMPRTESNRDLMMEIDSGIKKEVSVGCATAGRTCSICGTDLHKGVCGHIPGKYYAKNGKQCKCHAILSNPTDAYEWSFVAVPAQPRAGVTKAFAAGCKDIDSVIKALESDTSDAENCSGIASMLRDLKERAEEGAMYHDAMCSEVKRLALLAQPTLTEATVECIIKSMNIHELKSYAEECKKAVNAFMPISPQLARKENEHKTADKNYII